MPLKYIGWKGIGVPKSLATASGMRTPFSPFKINKARLDKVDGLLETNPQIFEESTAYALRVQAGVDAEKILAVIELHELVDAEGRIISVEKARSRGLIPINFVPSVVVRAVSETDRLKGLDKERFEKYFNYNQRKFGWKTHSDFFDWWVKRAAGNLARMHDYHFVHLSLGDENYLIDGGLVDTDQTSAMYFSSANVRRDVVASLGAALAAGIKFKFGRFEEESVDKTGVSLIEKHQAAFYRQFMKEYFSARKKLSLEELDAMRNRHPQYYRLDNSIMIQLAAEEYRRRMQ